MNWTQSTYIKTYKFAAQAHVGQFFKGTNLPYLVHIGLVAMELIAALSEDRQLNGDLALQCALLHDVIEDTSVTFDIILSEFGIDVANGVLALTKNNELPKEDRIMDSIHRILLQPKEIGMVKLADRITNLSPPPVTWTEEKINYYRNEAKLIQEQLGYTSDYLNERILHKIQSYGHKSND